MAQSHTLFIGMDVHKVTIAVAYVAQEHGARAPAPSPPMTSAPQRHRRHVSRVSEAGLPR
jgi:hypothetical protein